MAVHDAVDEQGGLARRPTCSRQGGALPPGTPRARIFAIACGYPDANDAARLADDPIHKMLMDRDPIAGDALASQPTLSRFENGVRRGALYRMGEIAFEQVVDRHAQRLRKVEHITV